MGRRSSDRLCRKSEPASRGWCGTGGWDTVGRDENYMATRIGLMGFGRIGRNLFRILHEREDLCIEAISDIAAPTSLEYLLRYDTVLGRFPDHVAIRDGVLYWRNRKARVVAGREPGDVPWGDMGVDVVVEATARYRRRAEIERHLAAGARRVILCVPPAEP